jgi:prepilin-type N-terminal cleavage/methylation domain-containing protein
MTISGFTGTIIPVMVLLNMATQMINRLKNKINMKNLFNEGFTLIELVIIMVVLGILAAVAVPRMGNTIASSEEAAENTVLASLRTAVEVYAMDQVVNNSSKSYPYNPFDELDKLPEGYNNDGFLDTDGEWLFTPDNYIAHQRNDNTRHKWYYDVNTGLFGARVDY